MIFGPADCPSCGGPVEIGVLHEGLGDDGQWHVTLTALLATHDCDRDVLPVARGGHGDHP